MKDAPTGLYVKSFNVSNVTTVIYDISDFHLDNVHYIANDSLNEYTYLFNVMGVLSMDSIPYECMNASVACLESDCSTVDSVGSNGSGYGFQINNTDGVCFLVGTDASYTLYDTIDYDPARGVSVRYTDGGYCGMVDGEPLNREFLINLICPTNPGIDSAIAYSSSTTDVLISNISVVEISICEYEISIESLLACPYQCITEEDGVESVCSGQGICAVDPELGFVRCLCDDGMDGIECTEVESSGTSSNASADDHSGFHIAIAIITVFLVLCLLAVVYLGMRHKRMKHELLIALMGGLGQDEDDFNDVNKPQLNFEEPDVHYNDESHSESDDDIVGDITPPVQEMMAIGNNTQNNDDVLIDVNAHDRNEEDGDTDDDEDGLSPEVKAVKKSKRMIISKFMAKKAGYVNANDDEDESDDD